MSRSSPIIIQPESSNVHHQPLLNHHHHHHSSSSSGRIAEVAGGTTAECAAVWCCFPCSVVNLLILAVYKVPVGLCRKAIRRRRKRRLIKKGLLPFSYSSSSSSSSYGGSHEDWEWGPAEEVALILVGEGAVDHELVQLEEDMWDRFYSTGFWRSPSQPRY